MPTMTRFCAQQMYQKQVIPPMFTAERRQRWRRLPLQRWQRQREHGSCCPAPQGWHTRWEAVPALCPAWEDISTIMHACNMAGKHACASWQEQFAQQWPMSNLHQRLASNAWQEQCTMAKVVLASHYASMVATQQHIGQPQQRRRRNADRQAQRQSRNFRLLARWQGMKNAS